MKVWVLAPPLAKILLTLRLIGLGFAATAGLLVGLTAVGFVLNLEDTWRPNPWYGDVQDDLPRPAWASWWSLFLIPGLAFGATRLLPRGSAATTLVATFCAFLTFLLGTKADPHHGDQVLLLAAPAAVAFIGCRWHMGRWGLTACKLLLLVPILTPLLMLALMPTARHIAWNAASVLFPSMLMSVLGLLEVSRPRPPDAAARFARPLPPNPY